MCVQVSELKRCLYIVFLSKFVSHSGFNQVLVVVVLIVVKGHRSVSCITS